MLRDAIRGVLQFDGFRFLRECKSKDDFLFFFFFQAEDGIRDLTVTGVQTCALPIFRTIWWRLLPPVGTSDFCNSSQTTRKSCVQPSRVSVTCPTQWLIMEKIQVVR